MKSITVFLSLIFFFLCFQFDAAIFAQNQEGLVRYFDSYDTMKIVNPDTILKGIIANEYFIGSVKIIFSDSSFTTQSNAVIKVYRKLNDGQEEPLPVAITDDNGIFYIKGMSLGNYRLDVEIRNEVVLTRYFFINDINVKYLEPIIIPVEPLEIKIQKEEKFQRFK